MEKDVFVKDRNGNDKFEAFELVKIMENDVHLLDSDFKKRFQLTCGAGVRIQGKLDLKRLEKVIANAYKDVDSMRAVLHMDFDNSYFRILEEYEYTLNTVIPEGETADERFENAKKEVSKDIFSREFYAKCACPILLYKLDENDYFLVVAIDHGMGDGQCLLLVLKKLILDYIGLPGGGKINKKGLYDFYQFYQEFKNNGMMAANTEYWKKLAEGTENLYHFNAPLDDNEVSEDDKIVKVSLKELKQAAKNYKTTVPNLVIAIYQAAIAKVYGLKESAITCVSANRSVPDFFDTVALQLDLMLLRNSVPDDETEVKAFLKESLKTTATGMQHTPSFYSQIPISRFLFSYAQDLMKGMNPAAIPGFDVTTWMAPSIPEHALDTNYIFLVAFEQGGDLEMHFAFDKTIYNKNDFINMRDNMVEMFSLLAGKKDLKMVELMR